jgi:hypothetical protein
VALDAATIAIVLDPDYAEELSLLARRVPVWVIDSPKNRPAIEALWTARRRDRTDCEVAVFREVPGLSHAAHLARIIGSAGRQLDPERPRLQSVEVLGLAPTSEIETELRGLGFGVIRTTPDGFRATATPGVVD